MPIPAHVAPRLKVDRTRAKATVAADPDLGDVTDTEVDNALAAIDQDAIYDQQRAGLAAEVWDRVSPINGVPAKHFHDRGDVPDTGDVYLLRDTTTGAVVIFQPHEPETAGIIPVPVGQGLDRGKAHADNIAAGRAAVEVLARVRAKITAARAGA